MSVELTSIKAGACFRFKTAVRRVIKILKEEVHWEYADGVKRSGRRGGVQWIHYFRVEALEQVPDPALAQRLSTMAHGSNTNLPLAAIKGIGFFFASTSRPQRDLERKKPLPPVATSAGTSKKSPGITMSRLTAATSSYDPKSSTSAVDKKKTPIVAVAKIPAKKCIFLGIRKPHAACKEQSKHTSQCNTPCLPNKSQQASNQRTTCVLAF